MTARRGFDRRHLGFCLVLGDFDGAPWCYDVCRERHEAVRRESALERGAGREQVVLTRNPSGWQKLVQYC